MQIVLVQIVPVQIVPAKSGRQCAAVHGALQPAGSQFPASGTAAGSAAYEMHVPCASDAVTARDADDDAHPGRPYCAPARRMSHAQ
ncbi:hypothetical protein [Agrilutibacter solisilvae]|uniref:Uncharacterized protein n=1 Tax=Agrilutibacter solisilvae TaxID=2763317 RepID=A0A974Y1L2_9GAMM|nr:hypothetical protein [Lysobacter solisilvae]QSX78735.1 hypothetical protein I8J32_001990 [Lysobacter solisilvae]